MMEGKTMKNFKLALTLAFTIVSTAPAALAKSGQFEEIPASAMERKETADVVPVAALAGQDKAKVAAALEKPAKCEKIKYGDKCYYKGGAVEIVFIGGKADWFSVSPKDAPLQASSLAQVGLPTDVRPAFQAKEVLRWKMLKDLLEVSMHQGAPGKVDFIYVKARTP